MIVDCFVTGKWEENKDAEALLQQDGKVLVLNLGCFLYWCTLSDPCLQWNCEIKVNICMPLVIFQHGTRHFHLL